MIKKFTSYPMTLICYEFTDVVSGKSVFRFRDRHGKLWLAEGRWSWFRVEVPSYD